MKYEVVTLDKKVVVGKSIRTTNKNGQSMQDIGSMWKKFINEYIYESIKNKVDEKGIGLYTEYEGDATQSYTFMCCCEVTETDNGDGLDIKIINEGKYAKFTVKGNMVKVVGEAWCKIWNMDLDRKYDSDFELYHNDSEDINNQTIDIFISLN
ncbi:GyrI-like domain-containing protein [Tepidibacter hydrothermalis]|uniref:GyrI-like domain-containing protein n=1 Tax=Tepidibacter hydrothermalis TaxID=3036126 RepID=A0ABY8EKA0_9FIRM|nr:GyrI-like domain-containing protein [Tepidibacter hydrothermalis]WFD11595.1 GyrI-like domain-containing protein [Tepidibacter hydrothermalis]